MKSVKRALKTSCILAAVWCLSGWSSPSAKADVLDQLPSDTLVVLKINHLQDTNTKVSNLLQALGVTDLVPPTKDPVQALETQLGIGPGLDLSKDAAAAVLNGTFTDNGPPPFVLLLPVSDYKAFLGSVTVVRTEGDVSVVNFKDNQEETFVENWGGYAAISDKKDNVSVKHEGLKPTGLSKKQLDEKDLCIYVNFPVLKDVLLPKITEGTPKLNDAIAQQVTDPAKLKLAQAAAKQGVAMLTEFLNDAQGTTIGLSVGDAGVTANMIVELIPGSYLANVSGQAKTTDGPLLAGLPKENYLFFGGSVQNSEALGKVIDDVLAPILKQLTDLGDDGKKVGDAVSLYKQMLTSVDSGAYGLVAPTAALGQGSLIRMLVIYKGDAEKIKDAQLKLASAQNDMMKAFGLAQADIIKTTITPNFKTVSGVAFDRVQTEVNPDNTSQAAMQMSQMLSMMYGPDGASALSGIVDPKTLVISLGLDDDLLGQTVDAAKAGTDVLTDGLKSVDENLPKTRAGVAYLGLGQLVTTGLSYAKANGMNVGVQLPNNLPPIGFSVGADATSMRGDLFIPTRLMQSMVQAGSALYQQFNNHNGGGGGGGL